MAHTRLSNQKGGVGTSRTGSAPGDKTKRMGVPGAERGRSVASEADTFRYLRI